MDAASSPIADFSSSLVGRADACALLAHQLALARDALRVVLIAGEPGIGKTHLLEWLAGHAEHGGATVLRGGASQAEGMPPYLPLLEALGQYVRSIDPAVVREQLGTSASTLLGIMPELAAVLDGVSVSYPLPAEQARFRLFQALGVFLAAIGASAPLVLLLDDLHWADGSTLDVLVHVARTQPTARLLLVGAYREAELETNAALQRAVAELSHLRRLVNLSLGPLSQAELAVLAANQLIGPVSTELGALLYRQSEGNPFFAEELLRGWREAGRLVHRGSGWTVALSPNHVLPATIVAAVQQRLARLSPDAIAIMRVASAIGRTFTIILLAEVMEQDVEDTEQRLQSAVTAHLIQDQEDGAYIFRHDIIRECLYSELRGERRRRLHARIGLALERLAGDGLRGDPAQLALHFSRSGDRERGYSHALQAAVVAREHNALEEAYQYYQMARTQVDRADPRYGAVLLQLGEAALQAGQDDAARPAFTEAQSLLLAADDAAGAGKAAHGAGVAAWHCDAHAEARVAFETALVLLREHRGPERVRVLVDLASLLSVSLSQQGEGVARAHQALELASQLGDARLEASAGRVVGNLEVRGNRMAEGVHQLEHALALAQAAADPAEAAECCACLANSYYWRADIQRSQDYTAMRETFARRCQQPYELRHVFTWRAFLSATRGDWEAAEDQLAQARHAVHALHGGEPSAFLQQIEGFLAWQLGDHQRAEQELRTAAASFRQQGAATLVWYLGPLGLAQLSVGKRREALNCLGELEALVDALPARILPAAPALICMLLMAVRLGDKQRAARYYPRVRAFSGQLHWFLADFALGAGQALCGDLTAAQAHLAKAELTARRAALLPALADIESIAKDLGLSTESGPALPAGLSRREVEVVRLVAAGMSNRAIARALNLSENTVAKHLTSIFTKTGCENRAAAATFAARHGLVR